MSKKVARKTTWKMFGGTDFFFVGGHIRGFTVIFFGGLIRGFTVKKIRVRQKTIPKNSLSFGR